MATALKHAWFKANFDITNRSAGDDHGGDTNKIMFRSKKIGRRGSDQKLDGGEKKKGNNFLKFNASSSRKL